MNVVGWGVLGHVKVYGSRIVHMVLRNNCHDVPLVAALTECVLVRIAPGTEVGGVALFHLFQGRVRCTVLETDDTVWELGRAYFCLGADSIVEIFGKEPERYHNETTISFQIQDNNSLKIEMYDKEEYISGKSYRE